MLFKNRPRATALLLLFLSVSSLPGVAESARSISEEAKASGAAYCWQEVEGYRPPDFDAYFPEDLEGAKALRRLWEAPDRDQRGDLEVIGTVRKGLRRYGGASMPLLRWFGNRFIWNTPNPHPAAVELMYHAADGATRGAAVYAGLSVMRPKPPAVLRTLVTIAMESDDPNDLSRIAWGLGEQRDAALAYLQPFLESTARDEREKVRAVEAILRRELKAFDWARRRRYEYAEQNYRSSLPDILQGLSSGASQERLALLRLVEREGIMLIMEESDIPAFQACADDPQPEVRRMVAKIAGEHWVWSAPEPPLDATDLLLKLSRDTDQETRYNAVYYGLSTIPNKEKGIIRGLVELALAEPDPEIHARIAWGLRGQRRQTREMLDFYLYGDDPTQARAARDVYAELGGRAPE